MYYNIAAQCIDITSVIKVKKNIKSRYNKYTCFPAHDNPSELCVSDDPIGKYTIVKTTFTVFLKCD